MTRRKPLRRASSLRRRRALRGASATRRALSAAYAAFRAQLLARDGWCQWCLTTQGPLDVHHAAKPRARYLMSPDHALTLCRACHARCEGEYQRGRLVVMPLGGQRFALALVYARDKWQAREFRNANALRGMREGHRTGSDLRLGGAGR